MPDATTPPDPYAADHAAEIGTMTTFRDVARDITQVLGLVSTLRLGAAQAAEADSRAEQEITQLSERFGTQNASALGAAMVTRARALIAGARSEADLATAKALMDRLKVDNDRRANQALLDASTPPPASSSLPWVIGGVLLVAVAGGYYFISRPRRNPRRRRTMR